MKTIGIVVVTAILITNSLLAGEIGSDQLIEGFIAVTQKAEGVKIDEKKTDEMRKALKNAKDNPLLAPYTFKGESCDRAKILRDINSAISKWKASDVPMSKTGQFASDSKNLESLPDPELVVVSRLVEQVVSNIR